MGLYNWDHSDSPTPISEERQSQGEAKAIDGRRPFMRALAELVEIFLIAGGLFFAVNLVTARVRVESVSMEPNFREGQLVVVNRLAYRWAKPERGDIIVFRPPINPSKRYIKRVIGLEGDVIAARNGQIFVNGVALDEPYLAVKPTYEGEWTVGPGELFVLGDNRNNSNDSKNWGNLKEEAVIGKAVIIYWPPGDITLVPHYDVMGASNK
jgi:signal peptidase I